MRKLKGLFIIALVLCVLFMLVPLQAEAAQTSGYCGDNLTWSFDEASGTLTISGVGDMDDYDCSEDEDDYNATWFDIRRDITAIVIEDGVTSIGDGAFCYLSRLTRVTIPSSVIEIGKYAFRYCGNLRRITIPDTITSIGAGAFSNCGRLDNVTIPDGVTSVSNSMFHDCDSLTSITIPNSVTTIGGTAFSNCNALTSITIPNSVTTIGRGVFSGCDALISITIPNSVTTIGDLAFSNCDALTSITIPDSVTSSIGSQALYDCDGLTSVVIGNSVSSIGYQAFMYCDSLSSIVIPDSVTSIGQQAFFGCDGLDNVVIGNGVTDIDDRAFMDCDNLTSLVIGNGISSLGQNTFRYCYNLTSVTIPLSVTFIGSYVFGDCNNITDVYYTGTREQWNQITIGAENGSLRNATIHYNSTQPHTHKYDAAVTAPTCTEPGYTTYACACGDSYVADETASLGHSYGDWFVSREATEVAEGEEKRTCANCGGSETRSTPKLEHTHNYDPVVTAPTCTAGGYTTYTCKCGDSYVAEETEALGHAFGEWYTTREATEDAVGVEQRDCTRCDESETRNIPKLDHIHKYDAVVTAPTCTEPGYTTYACACGDSYVADETAALGHAFGEWYITREATEDAVGVEQRDCIRCDKSETRNIPKLDHIHKYEAVVTKPTCAEQGYTTYTCECGDSYVDDYVDALGHIPLGFGVKTEPDCFLPGWTTYLCMFCGELYADHYVPNLGHDFVDGTCTRCGDPDPDYTAPIRNPFTDVPENKWFAEPVLWAVEKGITSGTTSTTFSPDEICTRAQVVTFLWRAMGEPEPESTKNPFTDVREKDYYYKAVLWAVEKGITTGTGEGAFSPKEECTRGQVVTFLWRAMGKTAPMTEENPFGDVRTKDYFYEPVLWAVENGITTGTGEGVFSPKEECTRGQVVTFLYRALSGNS